MKALVIDDEPLACELVEEYLEDFPQIELVGRCHDGFEGVKAIHDHQPEIIFLDVQMPKITGFEMLELLDEPPAVIFTTAFDEYALKAFEANAVDYLLKPFSKDRFNKAVQKFLDRPQEEKQAAVKKAAAELAPSRQNRVVIKDGAKIRIIPEQEIIRLEADGDYVKIYSTQGNFMKKKTLSYYENALPQDQFLRIHRSHLISLSHVTRIDPYEKNSHLALLSNGERIPVSRSGFQKVKDALNL